jgi:hypothetical protein
MRLSLSTAGVLLSACLLAAPAPAAPLAISKNLPTSTDSHSLLLQVQHRHGGHRGGGHHGGGGGGWGGDGGAAAAGIIGGLILGAMIASAAQRQQGVEYCMQRYRSYNPQTGIWIDRRGQPHQCP